MDALGSTAIQELVTEKHCVVSDYPNRISVIYRLFLLSLLAPMAVLVTSVKSLKASGVLRWMSSNKRHLHEWEQL